MVERTFALLKPDAIQRGLAGPILARFERRDGVWKIARRLVTLEGTSSATGRTLDEFTQARKDRLDPSYARDR